MSSDGEALALKIHGTKIEDTKSAWKDAKRGLLDYLAASAAGAKTETAVRLLAMLRAEGGSEDAPFLFSDGCRGTAPQSALYGGFIGHLLDYDDVHEEVRGHPGTVILPALLALTGGNAGNYGRFWAAYIIGVDVMARLGRCIPKHYAAGWHSTATFGAIGAAAACAWYEEFSAAAVERCMGMAATRAAGLRLQFGSDLKAFHAGYAARTGVEAVQLAKWGFTSRTGVLDGENGFLNLYGREEVRKEELTRDWAAPWRISSPGLWMKRYPFCSAAAHVRDAAEEIRGRYAPKPDRIERVEIVYPPGGDAALIHAHPENGEEGRFSPEYIAALILQGRKLTFSAFSAECAVDEATASLMSRTARIHDAGIQPSEKAMPKGRFTILRVYLTDGTVHTARVDAPFGSPAKPLSDDEILEKLGESVGEERAGRIWMKINQIHEK